MTTNNNKSKKEYDIIILSGGFDAVHIGHLRMMQEAKRKAHKVIVGCNTDEWLKRKKGYVFMPYEERKEILLGFSCVDECIDFIDEDNTASDLIERIAHKYGDDTSRIAFGNGGDRVKENTPEEQMCADYSITMVWGIGGEEKVQSSSDLVKNLPEEKNTVNHPPHYNQGKVEVIDLIEEAGHGPGFCYGNVIKYSLRAPHKGNEMEDLKKAKWYLERLIDECNK